MWRITEKCLAIAWDVREMERITDMMLICRVVIDERDVVVV